MIKSKSISKRISKKLKQQKYMEDVLSVMKQDRSNVKTELNNERLSKQINGYKQDSKRHQEKLEKQKEIQKKKRIFYY